jgi:hypothetical protein
MQSTNKKGKAGVLDDVTFTVDLRNEKASHWPFGSPEHLKNSFNPGHRSRDTLSKRPGAIYSSHTMRDVDISEYSVSPRPIRL